MVYWDGTNIKVPIRQLKKVCPACGIYQVKLGDIQEVKVNPATGEVLEVKLSKGQMNGYSRGGKENVLPFKVSFTQKRGDFGGDRVLSEMLNKGMRIKGLYLDGNKIKGLILGSKDLEL